MKHVGSWPRALPLTSLMGRLMVPLKVMPVAKGAAGKNFKIFIDQSLSWTPTRQTSPPPTLRRSQHWVARIGYLLPASSKQTRVKFRNLKACEKSVLEMQ